MNTVYKTYFACIYHLVVNFWIFILYNGVYLQMYIYTHGLGIMESIRHVKIEWWGVGVVICLERGADCLHVVQLMSLHPKNPSSLASFKSRLVLPFWYWLTQVVLEKIPLKRCSSSSMCSIACQCVSISVSRGHLSLKRHVAKAVMSLHGLRLDNGEKEVA